MTSNNSTEFLRRKYNVMPCVFHWNSKLKMCFAEYIDKKEVK